VVGVLKGGEEQDCEVERNFGVLEQPEFTPGANVIVTHARTLVCIRERV
jgi:hypothetical protein